MIFEIRADRDVTCKGPEGTGTRRRTVKLPEGEVTLTLGALPIYLNADVLPPEIASDEHLLTNEVTVESLHPDVTVIALKAERVQEEMTAVPPDVSAAPPAAAAAPAPPAAKEKLKAERVQNPTAVEAINKKRP